MAKTWIVCIDGTWNQPGQRDKDPVTAEEAASPSNVVRTWEALANRSLAIDFYYGTIAPIRPKILFTGVEGEVIYLAGIGTSGTVNTKVLEGATGTGTSERIRDAYRYLAERYQKGDRIYGFGFSRGAFAIRSLAGLIELAGLPRLPILAGRRSVARAVIPTSARTGTVAWLIRAESREILAPPGATTAGFRPCMATS